jgi:hypothetical protein
MTKCKNCHCNCHCDSAIHLPKDELDKGGACVCDTCNCEKSKAQDLTYENNGGLVIDDTDECESCQ